MFRVTQGQSPFMTLFVCCGGVDCIPSWNQIKDDLNYAKETTIFCSGSGRACDSGNKGSEPFYNSPLTSSSLGGFTKKGLLIQISEQAYITSFLQRAAEKPVSCA